MVSTEQTYTHQLAPVQLFPSNDSDIVGDIVEPCARVLKFRLWEAPGNGLLWSAVTWNYSIAYNNNVLVVMSEMYIFLVAKQTNKCITV